MDINVSQVGQNLAVSKVDTAPVSAKNDGAIKDAVTVNQQDTKDFSIPAEKEELSIVEVSAKQIEAAVSELSGFVQTNKRQLSFSVDEGSNKQVVKVIDAESGDIIRQIPTEEVLKLSERLQELQLDVGKVVGLLFNKHV
jgi:flagellar protein FlaG